MNSKESIRITRWGNGGVSCALVDDSDIDDNPVDQLLLSPKKMVEKIKTSIKVSKEERAQIVQKIFHDEENPFKDGDSVLYDGKPFTISRAYVYKGKPYCILSDKRQVAAKKLTLNKNKK